jgi:hypothetical protein
MPKEKVIDAESKEIPPKKVEIPPVVEKPTQPYKSTLEEDFSPVTKAVKNTIRAVGETGEALVGALQNRDNVVMVRVHKDILHQLDMLVDAEITRSRSESAAFLISEGVKANQALFDKIKGVTDQIEKLRAQLRQTIQSEGNPEVKK